MNNEQRQQVKSLSENTLHWALGTRVAVSTDEWAEAVLQAEETITAAQHLIQAIKEHTQ